jgi:hypothetical protein
MHFNTNFFLVFLVSLHLLTSCSVPEDLSDDSYTINGGGQMAEADNTSAGIVYHAVVNTLINISECNRNPNNFLNKVTAIP